MKQFQLSLIVLCVFLSYFQLLFFYRKCSDCNATAINKWHEFGKKTQLSGETWNDIIFCFVYNIHFYGKLFNSRNKWSFQWLLKWHKEFELE